jgi:hypothetical protein
MRKETFPEGNYQLPETSEVLRFLIVRTLGWTPYVVGAIP